MDIQARISALRKLMKYHRFDAYIIPSTDPHQSEYIAEHWQSRVWFSGFTGSAGTLVITHDHAGLWTDSRYFIQAEQQLLNSPITLHKQGVPHAPEHIAWLGSHLPDGSTIACDGMLFSAYQISVLNRRLEPFGISIDTEYDLVSPVWEERPKLPDAPIFEHAVEFTGKSRREKMDLGLKQLEHKYFDFYFLSTLDDIAWLLNIRGKDVDFNPVAICYLILGKTVSYLFIDPAKVSDALKQSLNADGIIIKPYAKIIDFLPELASSNKIVVDNRSTSISLYEKIPGRNLILGQNVVQHLKAIKNPTEVSHIRKAMIKDGVALTKLYYWLEQELQQNPVTEYELAQKLAYFRSTQEGYHGESFAAIVGYNGNGAIVHYRPMSDTSASIIKEGILLLDSGGQYVDGTTDITRTIALGTPTKEQKREYTLVLKGHIALATIQFPEGTKGMQLDTLARMHLWKQGLNYGHGTGHGVGYFLNVHEPPQGFATNPATSRGTTSFKEGMFTSNEPGFYKEGAYGIRIENLMLCIAGAETDFGRFLKFESLTLFPIATDLIEMDLLNQEEKDWLNSYHEKVLEQLAPQLEGAELAWLKERCKAI